MYVYILASRKRGSLYTGVTSDLIRRVWEHKSKIIPSFTKTYNIATLVHFEVLDTAEAAITREKQLKKWSRQKKIELIERNNKDWRDLYLEICK